MRQRKRDIIDIQGYTRTYSPNHHFADCKGNVRKHRLVYEEEHGCCLLPGAVIHHIDGKKSNNVWYNLRLLGNSAHMSIENKGKPTWCKGKRGIHSAEGLESNRLKHIGKVPWNKGFQWSDNIKKKISVAKTGKRGSRTGTVLSEETKKKISESLRRRNATIRA